MPAFTLENTLDLPDVQDILVFSQASTLSMVYTTSDGISVYSDGFEHNLKTGILPGSVHAKQLSDEVFLIGFVLQDGDSGIIHYDSLTDTSTEFMFSTTFTPTEVMPWQNPTTGELIAITIGDQNLAYGYAEYVLP